MEQFDALSARIRLLTKELRKQYYINSKKQNCRDEKPFGGSIRESIGPFPEFILKGRFCKRSLMGLCTPCFYSRLPEHDITDEGFNSGYLSQIDYICDNFDELVLKNQIGAVASNKNSDVPIYGMVCTPTGSYFDNNEYPVDIRKTNLKKLIRTANLKKCELALHIETHVEDVLEYFDHPDQEELSLLQRLNARIIFGFESNNEFSRNVLYGKNLKLSDFEKAVSIVKENGFAVGAFVFGGLFALNDLETIDDVKSTLRYLKELDVSPVIMFANTQKYTIPDVLLSLGKYKLLDAHSVLEIAKLVVDIFGCDMTGAIDPWFIADPIGGPPEPNMHIFKSLQNTACDDCNKRIYEALEDLRITKNQELFIQRYNKLSLCNCNKSYEALLSDNQRQHDNINICERIVDYISSVEGQLPYYVLQENPWLVKAELLCYGLALTTTQKSLAKRFNPYINEKGLVHAIHIVYKDTIVNVCVAEQFCQASPYTTEYNDIDNTWKLLKNGVVLGGFSFVPLPAWIHHHENGKKIGDFLRPHSEKCLSLWPSTECAYVQNGEGCLFCGLNSQDYITSSVRATDEVLAALKVAIEYNPHYEINLSGGTCQSPDHAIQYLSDLCKKIKLINPKTVISVECTPPNDNKMLSQLYDSGASAIIINIEIFDDEIRRKICPGKSKISIDKYFEALEYCVSIFGRGNVSSVIIMGLQPIEDVKKAGFELVKRGVIPTIMPFKPLDNTGLSEFKPPNPDEYVEISKHVANLMEKYNLSINPCSGCAACGGCSLEKNLT